MRVCFNRKNRLTNPFNRLQSDIQKMMFSQVILHTFKEIIKNSLKNLFKFNLLISLKFSTIMPSKSPI